MSNSIQEHLASIQERVEAAMAIAAETGTSPAAAVAAAVAVMLENERAIAISPVVDFIEQRPDFIVAMRNSRPGTSDYNRWFGHAEARRVLAEKLGFTAPNDPGEHAVPQPAQTKGR